MYKRQVFEGLKDLGFAPCTPAACMEILDFYGIDCKGKNAVVIGRSLVAVSYTHLILQMTWLKNLYMIFGNSGDAWKASQALPNTHVVASGDATVGGGWRRLPNYYAMRDALHMYYMN